MYPNLQNTIKSCGDDYTFNKEDTGGSFCDGWKLCNSSTPNSPWTSQDKDATGSWIFVGEYGPTYSGSGFVADLGSTEATALQVNASLSGLNFFWSPSPVKQIGNL